jgi:peroxiredoxin
MSLQDRLDAFRADFESNKAPRQAVEIMHRATAELVASGQAQRALRAGDLAPAFTLLDADGRLVRSADLLKAGPLVITFYRGVWCPYCNLDMQALEAEANRIRALGATLVGISPQTAANSQKARAAHGLSFPILSDPNGETAAAFGLRFRLPDDLLALYKSFGVDLAAINADDSGTLPMPARYIVDTEGEIVYAEVNPDYTRRPDPSELLPTLRRLRETASV